MAAASSACSCSSPLQFQQLSFSKTLTDHSSKPITRKTQISFNHNSKAFSIRAINSQNPLETEKSQQHCFTKKDDGYLYCEGVKVEEVIMKHDIKRMPFFLPKPFLLYSKPQITRNVEAYKDVLKGLSNSSIIGYDVKANNNFTVLHHLSDLGCGAVVGSKDEIRLAISAGFDPTRCIYRGLIEYKSKEDLILAAQEGLFVNINTFVGAEFLKSYARIAGNKFRVLLSIDPYIAPQVHPDGKENFKISFDKLFCYLNSFKLYRHELELVGVHCHLGSNITKVDILRNAAAGMKKFIDKIRAQGFDINYLNIECGLGNDYYRTDTVRRIDLVDAVRPLVLSQKLNLIIEPWASLIANTCCLVNYAMGLMTNGAKNFIVIRGNVAELFRPSLHDAYHARVFHHSYLHFITQEF